MYQGGKIVWRAILRDSVALRHGSFTVAMAIERIRMSDVNLDQSANAWYGQQTARAVDPTQTALIGLELPYRTQFPTRSRLMPVLTRIDDPRPAQPIKRPFALWALGFRPFYLLASVFAALSVSQWMLQFFGILTQPYLAGPMWHAHEMLFGFALAVVVGFLFTAGRNWSNQPTPTGLTLAAIAGLWVAARILVLTPFGWAAAVANIAFPLTAAIALAIPFYKARNRRNYFFVWLLLLMAAASLLVHLAQLQVITLPGWIGIQFGLNILLFVMVVMAGRVIPMFTNNAVPGAAAHNHPMLEKLALGAVLCLLLADIVRLQGFIMAILLVFAAMLHLLRWWRWHPWTTIGEPIVWILHGAYFWIPVHLAMRALVVMGVINASTATHALTVGAAGALTIGMMTRTARGHTGYPLRADGFDIVCYGLIVAAALVRVGLPVVMPTLTVFALGVSSLLWSLAWGLYAIHYWPMLSRARLDGKPG